MIFILKNNLFQRTLIGLSFIVSTFGCLSIKPSTSKSDSKNFETFFVGEEGTQYFIKPVLFKNQTTGEQISIDFTFRIKDKIRDSAIVNFSIQSSSIFRSLTSIKISNTHIFATSKNIRLLYNEKNADGFRSRFSTNLNLNSLSTLFADNNWEVQLSNGNQTTMFAPNKKTLKTIVNIRENIFQLFE